MESNDDRGVTEQPADGESSLTINLDNGIILSCKLPEEPQAMWSPVRMQDLPMAIRHPDCMGRLRNGDLALHEETHTWYMLQPATTGGSPLALVDETVEKRVYVAASSDEEWDIRDRDGFIPVSLYGAMKPEPGEIGSVFIAFGGQPRIQDDPGKPGHGQIVWPRQHVERVFQQEFAETADG